MWIYRQLTCPLRLNGNRWSSSGEARESSTLQRGWAAIMLGVMRSTAYKAIAEGTFPVPVIRVGGRWRVSREALRRLLDREGSVASGHYVATSNTQSATSIETGTGSSTRESAQSGSIICPACGSLKSTSIPVPLPSSRPICSAARLSSSGTESV